jgi:DNA modification methylase
MADLQDESVDLVVTSSFYSMMKTWNLIFYPTKAEGPFFKEKTSPDAAFCP